MTSYYIPKGGTKARGKFLFPFTGNLNPCRTAKNKVENKQSILIQLSGRINKQK